MNLMVSHGRGASDSLPTRIQTTWPDLVKWLYQHPRTPAGLTPAEYAALKPYPSKSPQGQRIHDDKDGAYLVLADFGGAKRSLDTLLASYGVPLDFDAGWITADVITRTLRGYAYVAYTTYAHSPSAERWRVFVPTAAPMDAATHRATWSTLSAAFSNAADAAAKDASRLSYLPGKTLHPEAARIFHADGALLQPIPATHEPVLQVQESGPVPGWAGPADNETLLAIACSKRNRPDEKFGAPVHFAALWTANAEWLAQRFPSKDGSQPWDYTMADMALAGELIFWCGGDRERAAQLMRMSGLAAIRQDDADWHERKVVLAVERAAANAKQYAFMSESPAPPPADVQQMHVTVPPPPGVVPTAAEAAIANAMPGLNDYWAYLPNGQFIHRPTGMLHVATSVDGVIGKDARAALVVSRPVHRMTWAPGYPERFQTRDIDPTDERGSDSWLYNKYQPPRAPTQQGDVSPWLNLLKQLYPDDYHHLIAYFADAVQHANEKCNHAVVLGSGVHGIGKDTLLAPVRHAVGERNYWIIKPSDLVAAYNPWVATRILQISESRDLGEGQNGVSRYEMYERSKDLCAAPPRMLPCVDKYIAQHQVLNVLRLILTTNHRIDGIYLPPEDRRHYCAWSDAQKMAEDDANAMWEWYNSGGMDFVANYLAHLDISHFNRSAPPPQTAWWHQLVEGGRPAEDERFADALEKLGRPEWVGTAQIAEAGGLELAGWMAAPGNRRKVEREIDRAGYRRFPNPSDNRGRWYVNGARVAVYRRADVEPKALMAKFMGPT